jgi:hypothetical protein
MKRSARQAFGRSRRADALLVQHMVCTGYCLVNGTLRCSAPCASCGCKTGLPCSIYSALPMVTHYMHPCRMRQATSITSRRSSGTNTGSAKSALSQHGILSSGPGLSPRAGSPDGLVGTDLSARKHVVLKVLTKTEEAATTTMPKPKPSTQPGKESPGDVTTPAEKRLNNSISERYK